MEHFLRSKKYWQTITIRIKEVTKETTEVQKAKIEAQILKDFIAKNYVFLAIDRSILETIMCKDTSKRICDSMKNKYDVSIRAKI